MILKFPKKTAIGLDLGDLSLKIVQLEKKGGLFISSFAGKDIPEGFIQDGEIRRPDELAALIKEAFNNPVGEPMGSNNVVCNLPEEKVFIRIIKLPFMKHEELEKAVRWETEAHIPLKIDEVYLDWDIIRSIKKEGTDNYEILIAAAPRKLVDSYVLLLQKSGLTPVAMEPESLAAVRALLDSDKSAMVVDIGSAGTNLVVFSGASVRFTSHVPISDQMFLNALMQKLEKDREGAEKVKRKTGLAGEKKVYNILEPTADELARQIKEYIVFYREHADNIKGEIVEIYLCGDGAQLAGLPEFLSQKLGLPVVLGDFSKKASLTGKLEKFKSKLSHCPDCTVALGLALRDFTK
jgi:type IV pilus assembly protein PilM